MYQFHKVLHDVSSFSKQKPKQTVEPAQYGLEINFKAQPLFFLSHKNSVFAINFLTCAKKAGVTSAITLPPAVSNRFVRLWHPH